MKFDIEGCRHEGELTAADLRVRYGVSFASRARYHWRRGRIVARVAKGPGLPCQGVMYFDAASVERFAAAEGVLRRPPPAPGKGDAA